VRQWWGRALPSACGQYNFDKVMYRYFKNKDAIVAALARNLVDYNWEWGIARWLNDYNFPAVTLGKVVKKDVKKPYPHGLNAIFLNTRKPHLQDRRVRKALNLLFNFEWLNHTVFFEHYGRNKSIYMDTGFGAEGVPSEKEKKYFKNYEADSYPPEASVLEFTPTINSQGGIMRCHFEEALMLLESAGWRIKEGVLTHPVMGPFRLQFLFSNPVYEKQYQEYFLTLKRFGIDVHAQSMDSTAFMARVKNFDYDAVLYFMPSFHVPGLEQENMWGSQAAGTSGSFNLAGVKNVVVDDLVQKIMGATTRAYLHFYSGLLDRILNWGYYIIPMWNPPLIHVAYWNKFSFIPAAENILYPHAWWMKG
ncbi:MAG: ABC transporter substrate-binding protein, partial [Gammaproteobacteria bacterium]|nr:ABC transporter substrate-binding protein [Gammaproteobacteria bacterium]